jgi:hypothetical protein
LICLWCCTFMPYFVTTVESSLFVGDQCLWISWTPLPTDLHPHKHVFFIIHYIYIDITPITLSMSYPQNKVPINQQNLVTHEHWPPRIKVIFHSIPIVIIISSNRCLSIHCFRDYWWGIWNPRKQKNPRLILRWRCC